MDYVALKALHISAVTLSFCGFVARGMGVLRGVTLGQASGHTQGGRSGRYGVVGFGYWHACRYTCLALGASLGAGEDCCAGGLYRAWGRGVATCAGGRPAAADARSAPLLGGCDGRVRLHCFGGFDEESVGGGGVVRTSWLIEGRHAARQWRPVTLDRQTR